MTLSSSECYLVWSKSTHSKALDKTSVTESQPARLLADLLCVTAVFCYRHLLSEVELNRIRVLPSTGHEVCYACSDVATWYTRLAEALATPFTRSTRPYACTRISDILYDDNFDRKRADILRDMNRMRRR